MTNITKARRIVKVLDQGTAPISFHWINESELVKVIKEELDTVTLIPDDSGSLH